MNVWSTLAGGHIVPDITLASGWGNMMNMRILGWTSPDGRRRSYWRWLTMLVSNWWRTKMAAPMIALLSRILRSQLLLADDVEPANEYNITTIVEQSCKCTWCTGSIHNKRSTKLVAQHTKNVPVYFQLQYIDTAPQTTLRTLATEEHQVGRLVKKRCKKKIIK